MENPHCYIHIFYISCLFFWLFFFPLSLSESSRSPAAISLRIATEVKRPAAAIMTHTANKSFAESGSI